MIRDYVKWRYYILIYIILWPKCYLLAGEVVNPKIVDGSSKVNKKRVVLVDKRGKYSSSITKMALSVKHDYLVWGDSVGNMHMVNFDNNKYTSLFKSIEHSMPVLDISISKMNQCKWLEGSIYIRCLHLDEFGKVTRTTISKKYNLDSNCGILFNNKVVLPSCINAKKQGKTITVADTILGDIKFSLNKKLDTVCIIDTTNNTAIKQSNTFPNNSWSNESIQYLDISDNLSMIAILAISKMVVINAKNMELIQQFKIFRGLKIAFSPNSKILVVGTANHELHVIDTENMNIILKYQFVGGTRIDEIKFITNEYVLIGTGGRCEVYLLCIGNKEVYKVTKCPGLSEIEYSSVNNEVYYGMNNGNIYKQKIKITPVAPTKSSEPKAADKADPGE